MIAENVDAESKFSARINHIRIKFLRKLPMFKYYTGRILLPVVSGFLFILLTQPVAAATSERKFTAPISSRVQTFTVEPQYSAYTFTWDRGNFSYSWDNSTWQTVSENDDTDSKENYQPAKQISDLFFRTSQQRIIYVRNSGAQNLQLILINTGADLPNAEGFVGSPSNPGQVNIISGASYSALNIVGRHEWGADENIMTWRPQYRKINKFIVHHTAWTNNPQNYAATIRAIYYYHAVTLGWGDIGYNYLIDPNGNIYEGRKGGDGVIGAHSYMSNSGSIGIAFMGTFQSSLPTEAARAAFKQLMVEKSLLHGINLVWGNSGKTVYGHRDMPENSTSCPGQALYDALPALTAEAEAMRSAAQPTSEIYQERQQMLTTLQSYTDLRLKLNFVGSGLSAEQVRAMVPANSGINKITAIAGNSATLYINSYTTYYYDAVDDTPERIRLLYLIFSLDPRVASIDLLTDMELVEPDSGYRQNPVASEGPRVKFSQPVVKGTGSWEVRREHDNSVFATIPADSSQVVLEGTGYFVQINPDTNWEQGENYYLTICATCVRNAGGQYYPGTTNPNAAKFTIALNWSDWQLQPGGVTRYGIAVQEFNGRLYQAMRGRSDPGKIWLRSSADGLFDGSDARENWSENILTGAFSSREPTLAVFNNRLYISVRNPDGGIYTRSMSATEVWDTNWMYDTSGTTGTFIAMSNATISGEQRLYQMMRGFTSNTIYYRYTTDGVFDLSTASENWQKQLTFSTLHGVSLAFYDNKLYVSIRGNSGRIWIGHTTDGFFDTEQLAPADEFTRVTPSIAVHAGKLFQVARGDNDNNVYTRFFTAGRGWSAWSGKDDTAEAIVGVGSFGVTNKLYQIAMDGNANIYQRQLSL
jgi:hypothetical protein